MRAAPPTAPTPDHNSQTSRLRSAGQSMMSQTCKPKMTKPHTSGKYAQRSYKRIGTDARTPGFREAPLESVLQFVRGQHTGSQGNQHTLLTCCHQRQKCRQLGKLRFKMRKVVHSCLASTWKLDFICVLRIYGQPWVGPNFMGWCCYKGCCGHCCRGSCCNCNVAAAADATV